MRVDQLSYAWSHDYKRREFVKFRHLLANTAKPSNNDSRELEVKAFVQPATDWTDVVKRDYEGIGSMKMVTSRRQVQPDHRLEKIDIKIFSLLKYFYSVA